MDVNDAVLENLKNRDFNHGLIIEDTLKMLNK